MDSNEGLVAISSSRSLQRRVPDSIFSVCFFIAGAQKCINQVWRLATCKLTRSADNKNFPHHLNCQLNATFFNENVFVFPSYISGG